MRDDGIPIIGQQLRDQAREDEILSTIGPALIAHPVVEELIRRVRRLERVNSALTGRVEYLKEIALMDSSDIEAQEIFDEVEPLIADDARLYSLPRHQLIQRDGQPATDPLGEPIVGGAIDEGDIGCTVTIVVCEGYGFEDLHGLRFEGKDRRAALTAAGDAVTAFLSERVGDE